MRLSSIGPRLFRPAVFAVALTAVLSACATKVNAPTSPPRPPQMRLAEFARVEMTPVGLAPAFSKHDANLAALRKIDENLWMRMSAVFPGLARVDAAQPLYNGQPRTLRVVPYVKEIKFIGGAARFFAGALAGSSAVILQVTYVDSATGVVIAQPEFYRKGNAMAGAYSVGATDNIMLDAIASDVAQYSASYR